MDRERAREIENCAESLSRYKKGKTFDWDALANEFGHVLLGHFGSHDSREKAEPEANYFAEYLTGNSFDEAESGILSKACTLANLYLFNCREFREIVENSQGDSQKRIEAIRERDTRILEKLVEEELRK